MRNNKMPELMRVTNITINEKPNTSANAANIADDHDIYKILNECTKDMGKYRQFVYYIGTSLDNSKIRLKIHKLQEKIFKSIISQKDSIIKYTKSSYNNTKDRTKLGHMLCFTLAILSYLESLVEKLESLLILFPNGDNVVVNLGFEDSALAITDDPNSEDAGDKIKGDNDIYDYHELRSRVKYIQNLKDEIEQIDVYQIRYDVTSDSQKFYKSLSAYNDDAKPMSIDADSKIKTFLRIKNCSRRKFICITLIITTVIFIIAGIICGIIYATK